MFRKLPCFPTPLLAVFLAYAAPAAAATHTVPGGGDLQAALDAAQPGDVILLAPGATYTGNFTLPRKAGDLFILVRTAAPEGELPPAGVRITPAHARALAKIKSPNTSPALAAAEGAHHWRLETLEFQANVDGIGDIITLGGSDTQTETSQMPHHIVLDRLYIHGDPVLGQKRGIALNGGQTEVLNSHISDIKSFQQDAQAIAGWNGTGPFVIENNHLEASGENVLFGGADSRVRNLVPSDITFRRNLVTKPASWRGQRWIVKNAFQLKNARRVLVEGNVFENVWLSGNVGFAIVFTPANQDGRAPWSVVEDVTFRYNVVRHAGGGVNMTGSDPHNPSGRTQRVQIAHNLFYDIDARWGGAGTGIFLQVGNSPRDLVVERNTVVHSGNVVSVYGQRNGAPWPVDGFVFRENLARHNDYGVIGENQAPGRGTLSAFFSRLVFERNVLAGGDGTAYPTDNYFPSIAEFDASFANPAVDDFTVVAGSPFARAASDGAPLGADLGGLYARIGGTASTAPTGVAGDRYAVCRPGRVCTSTGPARRP